MKDDDVFSITIIAICLFFMPIGLYFRIRSYTGEKIDRWQEGVAILFGLRLTALVVVATSVGWMIHPPWMEWSSLPFPAWLRWIGVVVTVCGACLWVWAVSSLGKNLTATAKGEGVTSIVEVQNQPRLGGYDENSARISAQPKFSLLDSIQ